MPKKPRVFHLLQQANSALFRAVDGLLKAREDIVSAHQVILFVLILEDGLQSAEVAKRAGMSRSRLTGLLDTMTEKGLVRREQSLDDGRVQRVFITPEGADIIKRTSALTRDLNADLLRPFDDNERETITAFLSHVSATAKLIDEQRRLEELRP
jgi:DNA-binding MarR family transcriptional regulator